MRRLALLVVVGCGRIAFDPLGEGGGPGVGDGGSTSGDGGSVTGDGGSDAALATCNATYGSGSTTFVNGTAMSAQINIPANSMPNSLIVVQIHWAANTGNVSAVTDTRGATYSQAAGIVRVNTLSQVIYSAPFLSGAAGTMTVTFTAPVPNPDISFVTFTSVDLSGGAPAVPLGAFGTSSTAMTPTTNVSAGTTRLVAALASGASGATAGSGFQKRLGTSGSMMMDRCAGTAGSHDVTASLSGSSNWTLHLMGVRSL